MATAHLTLTVLQKRGLITPAEFAFCISMSATCTPIPTWQRCGSAAVPPRSIPAAGVDQRVTVYGALEYRTGQFVTEMAERALSATFQAFVESLVPLWPHDHLVLVMDNASYHKSAALRHWALNRSSPITLLWLPTYSP